VRALISFVAAAVAVVCQLTIVNRIAFPGDAGPDLVLVLVAALALANGPLIGTLTGFWAGLALDVAPPGSHFTGQNALVFCLIGYACGLLADLSSGDGTAEPGHTALFEIVVTAVGAVCGEALAALLGVMLSDPRVTWPAITHVLPVTAIYDVVACPFVLYAAAAALRLAGSLGPQSEAASAGKPRAAAVGKPRAAATPRLRLAGSGRTDRWVASAGQGASGRSAPKHEPRFKVGHGSLAGGGLGTAFAAGGLRSGAGLARTSMGRSLLGGSVFNQPSPALARSASAGRATALTPRFSRGKMATRLTGTLRRPTKPRSPGRGWLRPAATRSSSTFKGGTGPGVFRRRRVFTSRSTSLKSGGGAWKRGRTPRLRPRRRVRLPVRKRGGYR
jgi:rod shape-determining protein MreD